MASPYREDAKSSFIRAAFASVVACLLLFSMGCANEGEGEASRPTPVKNRSLAGRPPWAFPVGISQEAMLAEMRAHLDAIAQQEPDARVLAYVVLQRRVDVSDFVRIARVYGISGGDQAAVRCLVAATDDSGSAITGVPWQSGDSAMLVAGRCESEALPALGASALPRVTTIDYVSAYASTRALQSLWRDDADVLAIGVGGREGMVTGLWRPIPAGGPIR